MMFRFDLKHLVNIGPLYIKRNTSTNGATFNPIENLKTIFKRYHNPGFYDKYAIENPNIRLLKKASVLVPISYDEKTSSYNFTLTKRSDNLRSHQSQVCFPGGMKDKTDPDEIFTAYREAKEEIGIEEKDITFIAQLAPACTSQGVIISPILVYLDKKNYVPNLNKHEVDLIFELPTKRFLSKENHVSKLIKFNTDAFYMHYFDDVVDNRKINTWGITAHLSICISSTLNNQVPEFDIDPTEKIEPNELNKFMERFLSIKSRRLIDVSAQKGKKM